MSEHLKRLVEEQNKLFNRMQEIQNVAETEARDWTAEERQNWDAANARIDVVSADIERLERSAALDRIDYRQVLQTQDAPDAPAGNGEEARAAAYDAAFRVFMRGGMDNLTIEQRRTMLEHRASPQGISVPADGGYLVPLGYRTEMTESMKAYGGLVNHANLITTSTGQPLQWPTNDDTSNVGAILSENTVISELGVTIGSRAIGAFTYTSKLVRVSLQLLQDSAFDLDRWLPRKLGERIGRAVADDLVNGTGTGEPTGILPTSTQGVGLGLAAFKSGDTGYNAMIDLEHSIDPAYRASGNCRFILSDGTLSWVRKMKDSQNRPLWLPVPVPGMPATINGLPYSIDQAMPALANPSKPILFGDFRAGYIVRQVLDVQAVRLSERYADFLQVGFFGFMRLDAVPDDAGAVRHLAITGA